MFLVSDIVYKNTHSQNLLRRKVIKYVADESETKYETLNWKTYEVFIISDENIYQFKNDVYVKNIYRFHITSFYTKYLVVKLQFNGN